MNLSLPLSLLITHFIGDFLLQSDWMALNKSRWTEAFKSKQDYSGTGMDALGFHALVYSLCFLWCGWDFATITFCLHFITDALTSRLTSRLWFLQISEPPPQPWDMMKHYQNWWTGVKVVKVLPTRHWFFVAIGFDQLLHYFGFVLTNWMVS